MKEKLIKKKKKSQRHVADFRFGKLRRSNRYEKFKKKLFKD